MALLSTSSRLRRVLTTTGLLLLALVAWSLATTAGSGALARGALFAVAAAALLVAFRPYFGPALLVLGVMALGMDPEVLSVPNTWGLVFLLSTAVGALMTLRKWEGLRWVVASFPFWALSEAVKWFDLVAVAMVTMGLAIAAVGPTLPGRRRAKKGEPLARLASGALVPIVARVYPLAHGSRVLRVLTYGCAALTIVLAAVAAQEWEPETSGALALASAIITVTFAFSNWFSGRVRLRIDESGLHSRVFFREHTLPWTQIAWLTLRYVFLPGVGARIVYYVVRSPTREFAFPSSMAGAADLQAAIESATGLTWPTPEITANM